MIHQIATNWWRLIWLGILAGGGQNSVAQEEFELDNSHTAVIFSISHFNLSYTYGRFNNCRGKLIINQGNPASSKFNFSVDAKSIDTNNADRDQHLLNEDFLAADRFPAIEFTSKSVEVEKNKYTVIGIMKMHGQQKEISIPLQLLGIGKGPQGEIRMGMIGRFVVKRSEFGMDKFLDVVGDDVAITFSFEAVRQEEADDKSASEEK
jgi:polyisoprenoid-binding protein YceI